MKLELSIYTKWQNESDDIYLVSLTGLYVELHIICDNNLMVLILTTII